MDAFSSKNGECALTFQIGECVAVLKNGGCTHLQLWLFRAVFSFKLVWKAAAKRTIAEHTPDGWRACLSHIKSVQRKAFYQKYARILTFSMETRRDPEN